MTTYPTQPAPSLSNDSLWVRRGGLVCLEGGFDPLGFKTVGSTLVMGASKKYHTWVNRKKTTCLEANLLEGLKASEGVGVN